MKVILTGEFGYDQAMAGLALSFNADYEKMFDVSSKLAGKKSGHDKFLRHIDTWWNIEKAPIFWWQEMDQYKMRVPDQWDWDTQSESTMHTLKKSELTQEDFAYPIDRDYLKYLNDMIICDASIHVIKNALPSGYLQTRTLKLNYCQLYNIIEQRKNHKLPQWHFFVDAVNKQIRHPDLIKRALELNKEK